MALKRPVEELRQELLADPNVQSIARRLGVDLAEYVEKVLDFAQHPDKQPELNILPEAEAVAQGAPSTAEVKKWLEDAAAGKIDTREEHEKDGFHDKSARKPAARSKEDGFEPAPRKKTLS